MKGLRSEPPLEFEFGGQSGYLDLLCLMMLISVCSVMRCASKRSWYRGAASKGRNGWRVDSYWRATRQHPQFTSAGETGGRNMIKPVRILGIAGSLRRESYNRAVLRAATQLVAEGASIEIFELDGIPGFNQDDEQNPPAKVVELKQRIRESDAILFVTPEYNYSVPGVLKNVIDWASRPYGDSAWNGNLRRSWALQLARSLRHALSITCAR
jgi:NADPH-dependent FMN reductase